MIDFPHKVTVPRRPASLVSRPRLLERLRTAEQQRLITFTAPAGYGKTSLLIDWASRCHLPVCWYSLDRFDTDPWTFVRYVAAAVQQHFPDALPATTAQLAGGSRNPLATVSATLARELAAIEVEWFLLLDDWHHVDPIAECRDLIERILLHCPHCHIILATRTFATLQDLMLLAARRQMSGLDEEQLRFTADELVPVLAATFGTTVTLDHARRSIEQANGWITGILLMHGAGAVPSTPDRFAVNAERRIYSFLAEQVFERQRPELRDFLLDAALLPEIDAEACDTLRQRDDSAMLLDDVLRERVFVSEVRPRVATFHPMFREFLLEHYRATAPQQFRRSAQRMARLYLARQHFAAAFDLFVAANDRASAQAVVAAGGEQLFREGRLETLDRWFAELFVDDLTVPLLCLKARVLLERGERHRAQGLADLAAARATACERPAVVLTRAQIARNMGNFADALALLEPMTASWTTHEHRIAALRTSAICQQRLGYISRAVTELMEALTLARDSGDQFTMAQLQHDLGICHEELGLLDAAERYYSDAERSWDPSGNLGMLAMSSNSKGVVQHLSGRYHDAYHTLMAAVEQADAAAVARYQATVRTSLADLYTDLERFDAARETYAVARQCGGTGFLQRYLDIAELHLLICERQYSLAAQTLRALPPESVAQHRPYVRMLEGWIAVHEGTYEPALAAVDDALALLEQQFSPMDRARAWLIRGEILARGAAPCNAELTACLENALHIARQLGHDAFVVNMALHLPALMRHASALGWSHAMEWTQRHRQLRTSARGIGMPEQRPTVTVRTLGVEQILVDGSPVQIGWSKAREVLWYLLEHPHGATPEVLHAEIWPEETREKLRTVKDAVYALRTALPRDLITFHQRRVYLVNPDAAQIDYDVASFLHRLEDAATVPEARCEALSLYGGAYLPASDSAWSQQVRVDLDARYRRAAHQAAADREQAGNPSAALALYQRIVADDQFDEPAHAGLMRCYLALGNRAAAMEQYHVLRRELHDELGLDLELTSEVEQLYTRILTAA